ncbi:hypothetical protein HELRODRAFT_159271 [Helobdella robusta]|uniref:Lipid-binding serum glycoprotein N-terminal domain-containing protein n=1 Tax=Helobdella robusta TaxID=6412 RepID=T1ENT3_HELRO|nr:hypothetical protein HELRODRAFT_159271 [Helobdella robusta]ESO12686.1 hypothetical protein HELRODRAFT_159271 [Helobdella robusta]
MFTYVLALVTIISFQLSDQQTSTSAGLKVGISYNGLNYAANRAIDRLTGELVNKRINDADGRNGDFKYEISNILIKDFHRPTTSVSLNADSSTLTWSLGNGKLSIDFNWHYEYKKNRFIRFSDSGRASVYASNVRISVNVKFGYDANTGRPNIYTTNCDCDVGDLDLDFHGNNGWLYNLLAGAIKSPLKKEVLKELCHAAKKAIDEDGNKELSTLDTNVSLEKKLYLDYRLTANPAITSNSVEFSGAGCVFFPENKDCPSSHPPMSVDLSTKMLTAVVSEESISSYLKAMFLSNQMELNIKKNSFEDSEGDFLDANCVAGFCFARLMHKLARSMPNSSFEILYRVSEAPIVHVYNGRMWSNISSNGFIKTRFPNNTVVDLFSISLTTLINITLTHNNDDVIGFKISNLKSNVTFDDSIDADVKTGVNFGITVVAKFAKKNVNKIGQKGLPLPKIHGIVWENSEISFKDRFIAIQSDVRYVM